MFLLSLLCLWDLCENFLHTHVICVVYTQTQHTPPNTTHTHKHNTLTRKHNTHPQTQHKHNTHTPHTPTNTKHTTQHNIRVRTHVHLLKSPNFHDVGLKKKNNTQFYIPILCTWCLHDICLVLSVVDMYNNPSFSESRKNYKAIILILNVVLLSWVWYYIIMTDDDNGIFVVCIRELHLQVAVGENYLSWHTAGIQPVVVARKNNINFMILSMNQNMNLNMFMRIKTRNGKQETIIISKLLSSKQYWPEGYNFHHEKRKNKSNSEFLFPIPGLLNTVVLTTNFASSAEKLNIKYIKNLKYRQKEQFKRILCLIIL